MPYFPSSNASKSHSVEAMRYHTMQYSKEIKNQKESSKILVQGLVSDEIMQNIAQKCDIPWIKSPLFQFPCGEWAVHSLPIMHATEIIIIHDFLLDRDAVMALGLLSSALVQAKAGKITVIVPYLPYGRQNKPPQDLGCKVLNQILSTFSIDGVISIDPHAANLVTSGSFTLQFLSGSNIFLSDSNFQKIARTIDYIISPDQGGLFRTKTWAQQLNCIAIALSKTRSETGIVVQHTHPEILNDKNCLIVDDILDSGHTLAKASEYLIQNGAKNVSACITHALFSRGCWEKIKSSGLNALWMSNSISLPDKTLELIKNSERSGIISDFTAQFPTVHRVDWHHCLTQKILYEMRL